jgi:hypothetical protein
METLPRVWSSRRKASVRPGVVQRCMLESWIRGGCWSEVEKETVTAEDIVAERGGRASGRGATALPAGRLVPAVVAAPRIRVLGCLG